MGIGLASGVGSSLGPPIYFPLLGWLRDNRVPARGLMSDTMVVVENDWELPFAVLGWVRNSRVAAEGEINNNRIVCEGQFV